MKILSNRTILILVIIGGSFYTSLLFYFIPKDPIQGDTAKVAVAVPSPIQQAFPERLQILAISVDAPIEKVGLTSNGAMDVPKNIDDVGWFYLGPRPGEIGAAVIDGHYGISKGKASIFDNLYKLRKGDKIDIEDQSGAIISFIVTGSRRYDPQADATSVFNSNDGKSHLNLITCEGVWDEVSRSYSQRLVLFTDRE